MGIAGFCKTTVIRSRTIYPEGDSMGAPPVINRIPPPVRNGYVERDFCGDSPGEGVSKVRVIRRIMINILRNRFCYRIPVMRHYPGRNNGGATPGFDFKGAGCLAGGIADSSQGTNRSLERIVYRKDHVCSLHRSKCLI